MLKLTNLRGRLVGAAVVSFAALGAAAANGDTVTTTVGTLNLSGPASISTGVSITPGLLGFGQFDDVSTGASQTAVQFAFGSTANVYDYQFTLGSGFKASGPSPYLSVAYNASQGGTYIPVGGSVSLIDVTDNTTISSVAGTGGALTLSGLLWGSGAGATHIGDTFEIALSLPASFSGAIFGQGNVPIPGALLLFGSALAGLGAFGARRRKSGPAA